MIIQNIPCKYKTSYPCYNLTLTADNKYLVTVGRILSVWNCETGEKIRDIRISQVDALTFSANTEYLAIKTIEGEIIVLHTMDYSIVCKHQIPGRGISDSLFFIDSIHLLITNWDGNVFVLNIKSKEVLKVNKTERINYIQRITNYDYSLQFIKNDVIYKSHYNIKSNMYSVEYVDCLLKENLSENEIKSFINPFFKGEDCLNQMKILRSVNKYRLLCENHCIENHMSAFGFAHIYDKNKAVLKVIIPPNTNEHYKALHLKQSAWSKDGEYFAIIFEKMDNNGMLVDAGVRIFETAQWNIISEISNIGVNVVRFTDDGSYVLIGSNNNMFCIELDKIRIF